MIDKIAAAYREARMNIISSMAGAASAVVDETGFYDEGYMQTQIRRVKEKLKLVTDELSVQLERNDGGAQGQKRKAELLEQRERWLFHLVFLASNSFGSLDDCVKLAEGHQWSFMDCVEGMREYRAGHRDDAFRLLEAFCREHGSVEEHFLVNKVFGLLLAERGREGEAVGFLTYALQFVPEDTDCLACLEMCLRHGGQAGREAVVREILDVLS